MDNNRKIGCLWAKKSIKDNREYMSGELLINGQKHAIVAFKRDKHTEKEPDWDILKAKPLEGLRVEETVE